MARFTSDTYVTANPNIRVEMLGFQSSTYILGRAGWRMAVERDPHLSREEATVFFEHKEVGAKLVGRMRHLPFERSFRNDLWHKDAVIKVYRFLQGAVTVRMAELCDPSNMEEVGLFPEHVSFKEVRPFESVFRPIETPAPKELIVDEPTVMELYDRILKLQTPKQAEIRERRRKETPRVEAQILSFGTMSP